MAYWLLKTEPSTYSFEDLVREKQTRWDGIANPTALKYLRSAAVGDRVFIYHTGAVKAAVGEAEIVKPAYDDPAVVDIRAGAPLPQPVTLAQLKDDEAFADSPLVKQGRLSFVPITAAQWKRVQTLAKAKKK